ncbi:MAG: 3-oxoacyl-ACP reductase [Oscillospiraceae bacterium]|nr:3-oxoacyl-ACP reductase [Oscillospiraceae bacterium]
MKTALITGGAGGIGSAAARRLAKDGYQVAIHYYRSREKAEALAAELGGIAVSADIANAEETESMIRQVIDQFGQLHLLVCNAGVSWTGLLDQMPVTAWKRIFSVNTDGVFHACRSVIPHFVHYKSGKIITVSSMWGQVGASCETAYSASKGAVIALTKALAKELGPSGITVNCVAPGVIDTEMNAGLDRASLDALAQETPLGRIGVPDDVAASIAFLASDGGSFLTGQVLAPNGGLIIF